jgi:hypothetical protein
MRVWILWRSRFLVVGPRDAAWPRRHEVVAVDNFAHRLVHTLISQHINAPGFSFVHSQRILPNQLSNDGAVDGAVETRCGGFTRRRSYDSAVGR